MKPDAPVNTQSAVYQAILEEEQNQRGDYEYRNNLPLYRSHRDHRIASPPTIQSSAFRRIEQALSCGEGKFLSGILIVVEPLFWMFSIRNFSRNFEITPCYLHLSSSVSLTGI